MPELISLKFESPCTLCFVFLSEPAHSAASSDVSGDGGESSHGTHRPLRRGAPSWPSSEVKASILSLRARECAAVPKCSWVLCTVSLSTVGKANFSWMPLYVTPAEVPVTDEAEFISIMSRPARLYSRDSTLSPVTPLLTTVASVETHGCRCNEIYVHELRRSQAHLEVVTDSPGPNLSLLRS